MNKEIIKNGIDYEYPKTIPFIELVNLGDTFTIKKLIENMSQNEKYALVNQSDRYGNTALLVACKRNDLEMAKLLIEAKANAYRGNLDGRTPLYCAKKHENSGKLIELLEGVLPSFLRN